jgi:hypothetical protein
LFAVGGAQQLNDKNGKKLTLKFASANKFAVVIAKIRSHLPGDDNLARLLQLRSHVLPFTMLPQFCFVSCGDAQFAPSPDALLGDLYRVSFWVSNALHVPFAISAHMPPCALPDNPPFKWPCFARFFECASAHVSCSHCSHSDRPASSGYGSLLLQQNQLRMSSRNRQRSPRAAAQSFG